MKYPHTPRHPFRVALDTIRATPAREFAMIPAFIAAAVGLPMLLWCAL